MREIKFRAWDKINKEWNNTFLFDKDGKIFASGRDYEDGINTFNLELMQFTGLLDKNGKEIYEGDIVEWKYLQTWHKNEVRWVGGGFVVTTSGFKDDLNEPQDLSLVSILNCEIIGNIYEHNHLIKES